MAKLDVKAALPPTEILRTVHPELDGWVTEYMYSEGTGELRRSIRHLNTGKTRPGTVKTSTGDIALAMIEEARRDPAFKTAEEMPIGGRNKLETLKQVQKQRLARRATATPSAQAAPATKRAYRKRQPENEKLTIPEPVRKSTAAARVEALGMGISFTVAPLYNGGVFLVILDSTGRAIHAAAATDLIDRALNSRLV